MRAEVDCVDWIKDDKSADAPNQKIDDLWSTKFELEQEKLRLASWRNSLRKYQRKWRMVKVWKESSEIFHLLKDVLPGQ